MPEPGGSEDGRDGPPRDDTGLPRRIGAGAKRTLIRLEDLLGDRARNARWHVWLSRRSGPIRTTLRESNVRVDIDRLYHGTIGPFTAMETERRFGPPGSATTRIADGPVVALYRRFARGGPIREPGESWEDVPTFRRTMLAHAYRLEIAGEPPASESELAQYAIDLIDNRRQRFLAGQDIIDVTVPRPIIRRMVGTDDYHVADGNNRVAAAVVRGHTWIHADVTWSLAPRLD